MRFNSGVHPPAFFPNLSLKVKIDIPEGTTLYVKSFTVANEADTIRWNADGPRHNAHLGFFSVAPNNTMVAFELAAAWNINRRDYDEYERLISYGVTEFTEDNHCSMGLNF